MLLAAPIYIDGWATPWYRGLRPLLYGVPGCAQRMKIEEEDPYGIKNEQLRAIVKAKFERGENFTIAGCRSNACAKSTGCARS